jgi:hypothetical protein
MAVLKVRPIKTGADSEVDEPEALATPIEAWEDERDPMGPPNPISAR